ncbi:MAG: 5-formyltetrahydrofolate cyclo-ligase [Lentisphaeraceae bacterium]|nr:5-formyltetrahydrofolate cyclo-ligase [Lentisphaeraceae bacterium]
MNKSSEKNDLRLQIKTKHSTTPKELSCSVEKSLQNWEVYNKIENLAFYFAMADEISVDFLFNSHKKIFLPRFLAEQKIYEMACVESKADLIAGKYGILEPSRHCRGARKNEIDLCLIPGMAFDKKGHRLGRGGGFYDRLLADENTLKVGVVEHSRLIDDIPCEEWDVKMDFVLTDEALINCKH